MAEAAVTARMTVDEFLIPSNSDGRELLDGVPVEVPASRTSAWLGGEIYGRIWLWTRDGGRATVLPADAGLQLWPERPNHVRKPDVSAFQEGHLRAGLGSGWFTDVPDLVVEVVSPDDRIEEFEAKLQDYRLAGVPLIPLIWVILPGTKTVHVYKEGARVPEFVDASASLTAEAILPGFVLDLADLFDRADKVG